MYTNADKTSKDKKDLEFEDIIVETKPEVVEIVDSKLASFSWRYMVERKEGNDKEEGRLGLSAGENLSFKTFIYIVHLKGA